MSIYSYIYIHPCISQNTEIYDRYLWRFWGLVEYFSILLNITFKFVLSSHLLGIYNQSRVSRVSHFVFFFLLFTTFLLFSLSFLSYMGNPSMNIISIISIIYWNHVDIHRHSKHYALQVKPNQFSSKPYGMGFYHLYIVDEWTV